MADAKKDKLQIRNSTVDFLVFTKDAHEDGIEVRVQDHDVWLTQKAIAQLFDVQWPFGSAKRPLHSFLM